jgi:hypothetical protein
VRRVAVTPAAQGAQLLLQSPQCLEPLPYTLDVPVEQSVDLRARLVRRSGECQELADVEKRNVE